MESSVLDKFCFVTLAVLANHRFVNEMFFVGWFFLLGWICGWVPFFPQVIKT